MINRLFHSKEVIRYLVVGVCTSIVSIVSYIVCLKLLFSSGKLIDIQLSNIISWICAVVFAYFTNRAYVFESKNKCISQEMISFFSSRIMSLLVECIAIAIFVEWLLLDDKISKFIAQVIVVITNYVLSKIYVFKS